MEMTAEMIAAEAVSKMAEAMTVMVVAAAAVMTCDDQTHEKRRTTQQSARSLDDADCHRQAWTLVGCAIDGNNYVPRKNPP